MQDSVKSHYQSSGIVNRIQKALTKAGYDLKNLDPDALAGADEFHVGGRKATSLIADELGINSTDSVLDVGCGIGGTSRFLARKTGARVTGIDLTPEFVDAAIQLSKLVGMEDGVNFQEGSATEIPFEKNMFDVVTMLHVGMNIDDKLLMMTELERVCKPAGTIMIYDITLKGTGALKYPMPWATTRKFSFPEPAAKYIEAAKASGLVFLKQVDHSRLAKKFLTSVPDEPPALTLGHLMGPNFAAMRGNLALAVGDDIVAPVMMTFRAN
ncbi:MAG: methyltransferase domain-containing protein [Actinomycetota bacterium]|nr:methyltransferase domain-containing protein [Acidimicrobiales bacterium]